VVLEAENPYTMRVFKRSHPFFEDQRPNGFKAPKDEDYQDFLLQAGSILHFPSPRQHGVVKCEGVRQLMNFTYINQRDKPNSAHMRERTPEELAAMKN
jgi:hypothetical protein